MGERISSTSSVITRSLVYSYTGHSIQQGLMKHLNHSHLSLFDLNMVSSAATFQDSSSRPLLELTASGSFGITMWAGLRGSSLIGCERVRGRSGFVRYSSLTNHPQRCPCPNLQNLWLVTLYGKKDFAGVNKLRILSWRDYPGSSEWALCNHMYPYMREAEGDVSRE